MSREKDSCNKSLTIAFALTSTALAAASLGQPGQARLAPSAQMETFGYLADASDSPPDDAGKATAQYDEVLQMGEVASPGLFSEAESAVRTRRFDRAIYLTRRALTEKPDDLDLHRVYAQALEGKLVSQRQKDPSLMESCVEQWLTVMRSGVGEESCNNLKNGVGGVWDFMFRDEERYSLARQHLLKLTGTTPHAWESNTHYMKRALKPSVKGRLLQKED